MFKEWEISIDSITAELLKVHKEFSAAKVHHLLKKVWKHGKIADKWNDFANLESLSKLKQFQNTQAERFTESVTTQILYRPILFHHESWFIKRKEKNMDFLYSVPRLPWQEGKPG